MLSGAGELWRCEGERDEVVVLTPYTAHSIPLGTRFQFRNPGPERLTCVIVTTPYWSGMDEAVQVEDHWPQLGASLPACTFTRTGRSRSARRG